jgi:signal transduction histidine kinase
VSGRRGGSGLGLAIVQRAVQAHRGVVFVDSAPGAGTTFHVVLPSFETAEVPA